METNNEIVVPEHYNPHQLVTYKVIDGEAISFPTAKVTDVEYALHNARSVDKQLSALRLKVSELEDKLTDWIESDDDASTIVSEICDIFGFTPTREVEFEATVRITGTIDVPLAELSTFDVNDVDLTIDVSSYSHNITAESETDYISTV
jgi:hypothetical protein